MELSKKDVVAKVAEIAEVSQADAGSVLDSFVELVNACITEGDIVGLPGLGKFQAAATSARTARNPHTGAEIEVPASYRVKFKPALRLKESAKA